MDDPNITMEEYIKLEEEKAQKHGKIFNWEIAKYGKIWYDEDIHNLRSIETEFPAIAFNDEVSSKNTFSCEPTIKNDNEKVNKPLIPPPEPTVSCFDDLDFFKDFENEFPAIVYNDAPTSKSDLLTELILSPQHIDEFDLNDETSLFEYDEEEQNVLYFNDLFTFNIIQPDDLKSEKDNDDNEVDIIQSSEGNEITQGTIHTTYSLNEYSVSDTGINTAYPGDLTKKKSASWLKYLQVWKCWSLETSRWMFNTNSCSINQHEKSTEQISGEFFIF
ncbi:hypothetical protein Tco_1286883 [Tanacetum coccineum]